MSASYPPHHIGLLDIPSEIQLQIAEFVEPIQALKALSVTSRSLRGIAQFVLFKHFQIDLSKPRGSIDDLNPRICAAIRFLDLRGKSFRTKEKLFHIKELLPMMVGLRVVCISRVVISRVFMGAFLTMAANIPLQVNLCSNEYPPGIGPTSNTPLRISHFRLHFRCATRSSIDLHQQMLCASAASLTELSIDTYSGDGGRCIGGGLMKLAGINLPFLLNLFLTIAPGDRDSRASVTAFITAQKAVRKLYLWGRIDPLPPDALPNLRELSTSVHMVKQLVPGRPVEVIRASSSEGSAEDWVRGVAQSTASVRKLYFDDSLVDTKDVEEIVGVLPSLETLGLAMFDDVSGPFRSSIPLLILLQTLPKVIDVLTSLNFLTHLHILVLYRWRWVHLGTTVIAPELRQANSFLLQAPLKVIDVLTSLKYLTHLHTIRRHLGVWVIHDISAFATKLRKANSCFSRIEIWEGFFNQYPWKNKEFVWNEVFGVWHLMESASVVWSITVPAPDPRLDWWCY
jgi:hypothetical protein